MTSSAHAGEDAVDYRYVYRTAREIYQVVYREDNLVVDAEATALARKYPELDPAELGPMSEVERRYITRCLEHTQGNVTRAAEILDMHRQSLQHKLRQLGLGRRYVSVTGDPQDNSDS